MYQRLLKRFRRQDGFTLIELIVVVAILGILAAVLTPRVLDAIDNAKKNGAEATGKTIQLAMERHYLKEGGYPGQDQVYALGPDTTTDDAFDYADLVELLKQYSSIDVSMFDGTTRSYVSEPTDAASNKATSYTLVVTLKDSSKTLTITPGNVAVAD